MSRYFLGFAAIFCTTIIVVNAVEPIWLSGKNTDYATLSDNAENFNATKGEWVTIDVATGTRGDVPSVLMDSKGLLWILFGNQRLFSHRLHAVWTYNPKTDKFRYVWHSDLENPRNPGELGIPADTNHPGGILSSGAAIDNNDNIWFTSLDYPGELWMFNTTSWTFVRVQGLSGTATNDLSAGTNPGQAGQDVWPGYFEGPCMVTDSLDNLWMLSGANGAAMNTVWHFNTTSKLWTFVHGDLVAIKDPHNSTFFGGGWGIGCDIDENDRIWIYGGWGSYDQSFADYGNIWTFDTRIKREWEFENGGDSTNDRKPQLVSDDFHPDNHPSASEGSLFIDRKDGTLMLVTGGGFNTEDTLWGGSDTIWLYSKNLKQWKLIHGNISMIDGPGAFTNYRAPGSKFPGTFYMGKHSGKNFNGDVFIVGGGTPQKTDDLWRKDFWIIPQDQCAIGIAKCDINANCVEELVGYSCICKDGFSGDGFSCAVSPVQAPSIVNSPTPATPKQQTSAAETRYGFGFGSFVTMILAVWMF